jgi:hypothetical protein
MKAGELDGGVVIMRRAQRIAVMRLVELINKLAAKPGWDVRLALRFLREKYEGTTTPRKLYDYIQANNGAGLQAVLQASLSFST